MMQTRRARKTAGQISREVALVILVCAIALFATLSVFVPQLRHVWTGIASAARR